MIVDARRLAMPRKRRRPHTVDEDAYLPNSQEIAEACRLIREVGFICEQGSRAGQFIPPW